ncbi:hypothetical protein KAFR_0C06256 [Kazachstania africana CBS 2517]|uniref:DUF3533 domain-containing protein n=1 Tax=Kazachstania africana (strain ATCC 22294 / BCRC 22015 / CBS 2517 / CECT 1963 / NBRC 1671 / NRRL Y-8276) TaxID=1071382 RepID=H2ATB9_KAZAF|nr:hypothetical protein KAFR_0C06256 [Kazachstania africana CBS 2517]CCF57619.1 hypothetical protein KAFR_0C06256 [Kazachstania africana CBS 2517]
MSNTNRRKYSTGNDEEKMRRSSGLSNHPNIRSDAYPLVETEIMQQEMNYTNLAYTEDYREDFEEQNDSKTVYSDALSFLSARTHGASKDIPISDIEDDQQSSQSELDLSRTTTDVRSVAASLSNKMASLSRSKTTLFSKRLKDERKKVILEFCFINLTFACVIFILFSIFWGNVYKSDSHFDKVNYLAVIQDDIVDQSIIPVIPMTDIIPSLISKIPGNWHIYNTSTFSEKFHVNTTEEINVRITDLIYQEKYFVSLNVQPNVTLQLYKALFENSSDTFLPSAYFEAIYESGRDPVNLKKWILTHVQTLESDFGTYYTSTYFPQFLANITSIADNSLNITRVPEAGQMTFTFTDYRKFYAIILFCTTQFGPVYTLVLTAFQFFIFGPAHAEMARVLQPRYMFVYRFCITALNCMVLSLFICTVSAIYQVDFTLAFGRAGFIIYWMSNWLYMFSCAGATENVVSLILLVRPPFIPIWMITFIILNLGPSYFTMALDSNFYRYGYAMPLHNIIDILRVIFFNTSRHKMGRNYGILVAWIVINTTLCPFIIKFVGKTLRSREMAAAKAVKDGTK